MMMNNKNEKFDIAVIGGGPAGMMAAGRAAELGAKVVLIEKNEMLGRKLLMTGGGRCNFTQAEFEPRGFIEKFQDRKAKFLYSSLNLFGPREVIEFFKKRGLSSKVEDKKRVFPVTDNAEDVLSALVKYMKKNNVQILYTSDVIGFEHNDRKISAVKLSNGHKISAEKFVLATGGKSYPNTGSTGDGYQWAKELGHKIIEPKPALVPVKTKEMWPKYLQGISLRDVEITIFQDNNKISSRIGDVLFSHFGLTGPAILADSRNISEKMKNEDVIISINLFPEINKIELDKKLISVFNKNATKEVGNISFEWVSRKLWHAILNLCDIELETKANAVSKERRKKIVESLKDMRLTVDSLFGFEQAMITSGGVDLKEVDSKTMKSKIVDNLYFAGEILDLDGPTGGYNLQICWSTGHAAGTYAAKN